MEIRDGSGVRRFATYREPRRELPPIEVSRFDPATGEHISGPVTDTARYRMAAARRPEPSKREIEEARAAAEAEGASIARAMAARRRKRKPATSRRVPVEVDGKRYETIKEAALSIGGSYTGLFNALAAGKRFKGHAVRRLGR